MLLSLERPVPEPEDRPPKLPNTEGKLYQIMTNFMNFFYIASNTMVAK
jgi:hypothetical protein